MPNTIQTLPADLPQNWTRGQVVAPDGAAVGLTEQHGFNYLCRQVNDAQRVINEQAAVIAQLQERLERRTDELPLPVLDGYSNTACYAHTYDGKVMIYGRVVADDSFITNEVFAQMPEGARPSRNLEYPAVFNDSNGFTYGTVLIYPDGTIFIRNAKNTKYIYLNMQYIATQ